MSENSILMLVYLRNSRAITCNIRLDDEIFSHNLLRSELISTSLWIGAGIKPAVDFIAFYIAHTGEITQWHGFGDHGLLIY
jgi:hypothetical protein